MMEKHITSPRGDTYYWVAKCAAADTPALIFLPGLTANHHLFDKQVEFFAVEYTTIVWDAPAHGQSRPYKDFSYGNAAEELKKILDTEGICKVVLVGQSAGGFVAQSFYKVYPEMVKGIVAIGTTPYGPEYFSASDLFWLRQTKWMFNLYPDGLLRSTMAKMCADTPRARENMITMLRDYQKDELCHLMYLGFAGFIPELCEMHITCPVTLLVGSHDRTGKVMVYNKKWQEREGFPLVLIEGAAHNANDDQPERVNAIISDFIGSL